MFDLQCTVWIYSPIEGLVPVGCSAHSYHPHPYRLVDWCVIAWNESRIVLPRFLWQSSTEVGYAQYRTNWTVTVDTPICNSIYIYMWFITVVQCTSLIFQRITTRVYCVGSYKATNTPFCVGLSNLLPLDMKMNTIQFYDFVFSFIIFQRNGYWVLYALLDWNYMEFTIRSNKLPIDCHRLIDMFFFHCHVRLLRLLVHLSAETRW